MKQVFLKVVDPEVAEELASLGFQYIKEQNSFAFLCSDELVEVFLNQQVRFVKENPEILIPGYDKAKAAYEAKVAAETAIENLTEDEKTVFNLAIKGINVSKCVDLAKIYVKKLCKK